MKKSTKIIFVTAVAVFFVVVFYVVVKSFSWKETYELTKVLTWGSIALFIGAILLMCLGKATRFFIILRVGGVKTSFIKTLMIFIPSQAFTPLPGGEVARALLFKNKLHVELKEVALPVYLQAVMELWTAVCLALVSVFFINLSFGIWFVPGLIFVLVILSAAIFIPHKLATVVVFLQTKGLRYAWVQKMIDMLEDCQVFMVKGNGNFRWKLWGVIIALGLASHAVAGFLFWYIARLQGAHISVLQSMFAAVMGILIQGILGFIPGGLGVTEGGLVGILISYGINIKKSVVITLLYRAVILPLLIIIALVFLFFLYLPGLFSKISATLHRS